MLKIKQLKKNHSAVDSSPNPLPKTPGNSGDTKRNSYFRNKGRDISSDKGKVLKKK